MTPRPADFEVLQRPVWDPAPGTACLWKCIKEKPLAMHRLSDRVLGSLYIAITGELIEKSDCNLNESDLAEDFSIRSLRCRYNLGHGLLTPDGKAVVSIPAPKKRGGDLVLRGSGNATAYLPVVRYDHKIFQDKYPNWEQWRDELMFRRRSDGTLEERALLSYSGNSKDSTPPDWPQGLTRDRELASEDYYRKKNLNLKTGLPNEAISLRDKARQALSQTLPGPSTPLNPTASSSPLVKKRKNPSVATDNYVVIPNSEDEIDTSASPNKKQKNAVVEHVQPESADLPRLPTPAIDLFTPAIASIEVHKAAIRAAFQDRSANRTELFWTLLPYITLAEAEEILIRCKGSPEVKNE